MVFVVHPVTWKALCKPVPCCRHEQQLQEALSCLSRTRAGTSLVPRRARLASLHSWEKEILFTAQEAEARPPTALSFTTAPVLLPGLACLAASRGFLGYLPQTGDSGLQIWGSGLASSIKLHLGLRVVPPSTAQMLRPLGSCWVTTGHGVLMALSFPSSILFATFWC